MQNQNARSGSAVPTAAVEGTINERLNRTLDNYTGLLDRLEVVLSRVNGTPNKGSDAREIAQIRPTLPLTAVVENMEGTADRLTNLVIGIERIA